MAKQIIITSKLTFYNGCTRRINRLKQLGWLNEDTRGTVPFVTHLPVADSVGHGLRLAGLPSCDSAAETSVTSSRPWPTISGNSIIR